MNWLQINMKTSYEESQVNLKISCLEVKTEKSNKNQKIQIETFRKMYKDKLE